MSKLEKNVARDTDAYKIGHWKAINPTMDGGIFYEEARKGAKYERLCVIGPSVIIQDHFMDALTERMVKQAERRASLTLKRDDMFNLEMWNKVKDLGHLPVRIKAVPEGTWVPNGNVVLKYEPTEKWFAKAANTIEGTLMHTRYMTDACTRSGYIKQNILPAWNKSSDLVEFVLPIAVNDFGYRGTSGWEQSVRGGIGHLVHFSGSDNLPAMEGVEAYYGMADLLTSVWATEHSVQLSFPNDLEYVLYQLKTAHPSQHVSIVMDGRDQDAFALEVICHPEVQALVKYRFSQGGLTIWRPDTGKPIVNVCKYSDVIGACYGFSMNSKGYKKLNFGNGLIQGDGMDEHSIPALYNEYIKTGWAADNALTGSGGGLLYKDLDRDFNRWAIKPCEMSFDGVRTPIAKVPKSDPSKTSKYGDVKLHPLGRGEFMTIESGRETPAQFNGYIDALETVYENGIFYPQKFEDIRERASKF